MHKKMQTVILISLALAFLLVVNIYLFVTPKQPTVCYEGVCVHGTTDAVSDFKALRNSSNTVYVIAEADAGKTQKNKYIDAAMGILVQQFGGKNITLVGISVQNNAPVSCLCETILSNTTAVLCLDNSTAFCTGIKPSADSTVFKIAYPAFSQNSLTITNRSVVLQAMTGEDAFALAKLVERLFE